MRCASHAYIRTHGDVRADGDSHTHIDIHANPYADTGCTTGPGGRRS